MTPPILGWADRIDLAISGLDDGRSATVLTIREGGPGAIDVRSQACEAHHSAGDWSVKRFVAGDIEVQVFLPAAADSVMPYRRLWGGPELRSILPPRGQAALTEIETGDWRPRPMEISA